MNIIGVRWHLSQKINAQIAASEIVVFEMATKCFFLQYVYVKIFASFYSNWFYQKKQDWKIFSHNVAGRVARVTLSYIELPIVT